MLRHTCKSRQQSAETLGPQQAHRQPCHSKRLRPRRPHWCRHWQSSAAARGASSGKGHYITTFFALLQRWAALHHPVKDPTGRTVTKHN